VRRPLALALITCCVGVAACGDDDEEAPSNSATTDPTTTTGAGTPPPPAEAEPSDTSGEAGDPGLSIAELVDLVLTSDQPGDVCRPPNVTDAFLRTGYGGAAGCDQAIKAGGAIAESVEVEVTEESGGAATATAVATGGVYDGEKIELALVEVDGQWSIDRLEVDVPAGP